MSDCDFWELGLDGYMKQLRAAAKEKSIPFKGVFELTPRCNFDCNMCYVHLKPDEIPAVGREFTTEEWISIAREAQEAGTIELTLTGGEPFVRPDFREIYEAIHDMGFLIQIFSNGYLLTEETVEWLKKRPPHTMRFTLYGASDETYEKVCGIKQGFTRVKHSVELLKKAGIPVVCSGNCGFENFVRASGGVVLNEPFSQHEFEREVAKCIGVPGRLEKMTAAVRNYAKTADFYQRAEVAVNVIEGVGHALKRGA